MCVTAMSMYICELGVFDEFSYLPYHQNHTISLYEKKDDGPILAENNFAGSEDMTISQRDRLFDQTGKYWLIRSRSWCSVIARIKDVLACGFAIRSVSDFCYIITGEAIIQICFCI